MTFRQLLLLWQLPFWCLLLLVTGTLYRSLDDRVRVTAQATQIRMHTARLEETLQSVLDMETGVRGYVIAGREDFLDPYQRARERFPLQFAQLRLQANAQGTHDLDEIERLVRRWASEVAEPEIAARRAGRLAQAQALVKSGRGKALIDQVRRRVATYAERENQQLTRQEAAITAQLQSFRRLLLGAGALLLLVSVAGMSWVSRRLEHGFQAVTDAARRMTAGQQGVKLRAEGTREFQSLSDTFNGMSSQLAQAQAEALERTDDLAARNLQMRTLGELSDWLQAARTLEEGAQVLSRALPTLLPGTAGLLLMHNASRNLLTPLLTWNWPGEATPSPPDHCWALRRGEARFPGEGRFAPPCLGSNVPCPHAAPSETCERQAEQSWAGEGRAGEGQVGQEQAEQMAPHNNHNKYVCFPLFSHGETLGVLRLMTPQGAPPSIVDNVQELRQLLVPLTRQMGLALSALQLQRRLLHQTLRDPLTGLSNRRHLEQELEQRAAQASSEGRGLACIALDVDHFKRLNDTFGHDAGDAALVRLGAALRDLTPPGALAARTGGEEFCLLLPGACAREALALAEQVRAEVAGWTLTHAGISLGQVTVSLGVAAWESARSPGALIKQADEALYRSKTLGRNRVTLHSPAGAAPGAGLAGEP